MKKINSKANSRPDFDMKRIVPKSKRSQGWGMDLVVATGIFTLGLIAFYLYSINSPEEARENMENLLYDGKILANTILSEGSPVNWNETNVVKIGILSNNKINETKLEYFYNLTTDDYNRTKNIFNINYDYYFYLNDTVKIGGIQRDGIGKFGVTRAGVPGSKNLIKVTRYTIYNNTPTTAYFYVWEE